jgi:hypothetical protein
MLQARCHDRCNGGENGDSHPRLRMVVVVVVMAHAWSRVDAVMKNVVVVVQVVTVLKEVSDP